MNIKRLIKILFILSLILFIPVLESDFSITLFPEIPEKVSVTIHNPTVILISDKSSRILYNLSYYDPNTKEQVRISQDNSFFTKELELNFDKPGSYLFEFISEEVVEIHIQGKGVYTISWLIFFILFMLNAVLISKEYILEMKF